MRRAELDSGTKRPGISRVESPRVAAADRLDASDHHVAAVAIRSGATTSEAVIAQLGRLTQLRALNLNHITVHDSALIHLSGLKNLSSLAVNADHRRVWALARFGRGNA
jgi:hypothetical protein